MPKIIEAVYENGVFKPLQKVDLKEGEKIRLRLDERGYIDHSLIRELEVLLKNAPKTKIDLRELERLHDVGKMLY
ncbi:hypothetical protein AFULGI_00003120 [Archaeoglobus fulgidus DSM 8774]|jgi:predicted DNA-binding antitoxin AbrB/MazE fold protein|uniref:Antitoxin n=2 Tax=Archaeoglobus fulgidus TaxID=2234 RepID=A0A075WHW4_ARCFL|nr:antitoxin family protein [Archaeoglobus fulgidus]AIG97138.1 hypothetical protein AFULGI_00003120 [Archaeoglobus fulgidus DSM 8774]KUK05318.1 MAG: Uncharacterized protein XD48_2444 [Archaeoglobus fulgidus]